LLFVVLVVAVVICARCWRWQWRVTRAGQGGTLIYRRGVLGAESVTVYIYTCKVVCISHPVIVWVAGAACSVTPEGKVACCLLCMCSGFAWRYSLSLGGYLTNLKDAHPIPQARDRTVHQIHCSKDVRARRDRTKIAWREPRRRRIGAGEVPDRYLPWNHARSPRRWWCAMVHRESDQNVRRGLVATRSDDSTTRRRRDARQSNSHEHAD
jgi:hypothetical protein